MKLIGIIAGFVFSIGLYYLCAFYGWLFNPYVMLNFLIPVLFIVVSLLCDKIRDTFGWTIFSVSILVGAFLNLLLVPMLTL